MADSCCCNNDCKEKQAGETYKFLILRLAFSTIAFASAFFIENSLYLFLVSYALSGADVLYRALKNIFKGQIFDENFLMGIATVGAFIIGEYPEGAAVMLFYQVGELLQEISVGRTTRAIKELINILPDYATLPDGTQVNPENISVGDVIIARAGERIPLDGVVIEGAAAVDASALTGESVPKDLTAGDTVLSGFICQNGLLTIRVKKKFAESTASKILKLTEQAGANKSQTERFITRFAKVYTPVVTAAALLIAIIPPIFFNEDYLQWIYKSLIFLVASCPCALVISIPLGFFGGLGRASKKGILIKGSNYLEFLRKADTVAFDKTGTLTKGVLSVKSIHEKMPGLLETAAHAEYYSNHPIAKAILKAYDGNIDTSIISEYSEIAGMGVRVKISGKEVVVGNERFVKNAEKTHETALHLLMDGKYAGYITISDEIKPEAKTAIKRLRRIGIKKMVILTGDTEGSGDWVAKHTGINTAYYSLLPQDKLEHLNEIKQNGTTVFVGDGINDAPALALADVGVAMGGLGSDAAIEAADVVIMTDELTKLADAIEISKMTHKIVWQNIILSIIVKVLIMILASAGMATMWHAVFADVGVALVAIVNTIKLLILKNGGNKNGNDYDTKDSRKPLG
jgi:Cd2+/Zn2+-exporting ATPase